MRVTFGSGNGGGGGTLGACPAGEGGTTEGAGGSTDGERDGTVSGSSCGTFWIAGYPFVEGTGGSEG